MHGIVGGASVRWNPYSYVGGNPINHVDPTGMCIDGISTVFCVAALGGAIGGLIYGVGSQVIEGRDFNEIDWRFAAMYTGVGTLGGAYLGLYPYVGFLAAEMAGISPTISLAHASMIAGGAIVGAENFAYQVADLRQQGIHKPSELLGNVNYGEVGFNAAIGAAGGYALGAGGAVSYNARMWAGAYTAFRIGVNRIQQRELSLHSLDRFTFRDFYLNGFFGGITGGINKWIGGVKGIPYVDRILQGSQRAGLHGITLEWGATNNVWIARFLKAALYTGAGAGVYATQHKVGDDDPFQNKSESICNIIAWGGLNNLAFVSNPLDDFVASLASNIYVNVVGNDADNQNSNCPIPIIGD